VGGTTNAYATTKFMTEQMLADIARCDPTWRICILRYFNPVGAHPSGTLGEDPRGIPNCLMPYVQQVLVGRLEKLTVFGKDYPTRDGTCIRDYIHVRDLASAHILALHREQPGFFNVGTGNGYSVKQVIEAAKKVTRKEIPVQGRPARAGDPPKLVAASQKLQRELGWKPVHSSLDQILASAWDWHQAHPRGYAD
jgi:UDP-glucose 4-epimerase